MHPNLIITAIVTVILAGCAVGPNFRQPDAPNTKEYTAAPLPTETAAAHGPGGAAQRLIAGKDIPSQWWTLFHSESLDRLIRDALEQNPTLASAQATLRQTQENMNAFAGSALYPHVDAKALASRQKISGAALGQPNFRINPFTLYNASVDVSYALDIFGSTKRELEALQSQVDYQGFRLEGANLTITGNIVTTVIKEASLRSQIQATQEIISAQEAQFKLIERQFQLGAATRTDLLTQQTQLAQTQATLPPLEKQLQQTRHQLAVLAGRFPSESGSLPEFDLGGLHFPEELPVSLPSLLVRQLQALADATRRRILELLKRRGCCSCEEIGALQSGLCVCDLQAALGLTQPTITHHIQVLRENGLIETQKIGRWLYCRRNEAALDRLAKWLREL